MDKLMLIIIVLITPVIHSLRDVRVLVPEAVKRYDTVELSCSYDLEGDSLYSVKWYKGRREFYRYTPKENPAMKIFPIGGATVVRSASNESQLTLSNVSPSTSGKYSCEVSADAPSFHTLIVTGDLEVVDVPETRPTIHGIRSRYKPGEILRGNCTSKYSKPGANLTWTINDVLANPSHIRPHKPIKANRKDNELEISVLGLHFVVSHSHFSHGKLKIKCIARIHNVYHQSTERSIEEERPRVIQAASSSQNNQITLGMPPYSQYDPSENEVGDKRDYLTHIQGEMASQNTGVSRHISSGLARTLVVFYLCKLVLTALGL